MKKLLISISFSSHLLISYSVSVCRAMRLLSSRYCHPPRQAGIEPTRANVTRCQIDILVKDAKARPFRLLLRRSFDTDAESWAD
ncbi:hypothetical protein C8J56DRAFT_924848 [Mycena floridula]|nr:hypothetical protein C8J56DRAFT_924848 [Mycena floridula]